MVRAGYLGHFTLTPGIDTIAVPAFDIDRLGHRQQPQFPTVTVGIVQDRHVDRGACPARLDVFSSGL